MDGVFINQKRTRLYNIIGLVCGLFSILLFTFVLIVDRSAAWDYVLFACGVIFFALIISILCGVSLYVNKRAFIHMDEEHISAFCQYGLSLECKLTDVKWVTYGGAGLDIRLKNGKKYNLINLENADQLGRFIVKRIPEPPVPSRSKESLIAELSVMKRKRNREAIVALSGFVLLIPLVLVGSAVTGNAELHQFGSDDWRIFAILATVGILMVIVACVALRRAIAHIEELDVLRRTICQMVFQTTPLQPGNAIRVFAEYYTLQPSRLTVYEVPGSEQVYYILEDMNQNFELEYVTRSAKYSDIDTLLEEIDHLLEVLHTK